MEKKNILKLLALIVLMTVACCGVAFATSADDYLKCSHTAAQIEAAGLELGDRVEIMDVDSTDCKTSAQEAYVCPMDHANKTKTRVCMVETGEYADHTWTDFVETSYANFGLQTKADCTGGAVTNGKMCLVCKSAEKEDVEKFAGDYEVLKNSNSEQYYVVKYTEGTKDTTVHPGTKLENGYIQWVAGVPETGYVWEAAAAATCNTYAYDQYKCAACGQSFKVYEKDNKPVHKLVVDPTASPAVAPTYDEVANIFNAEGAKVEKKDATCQNGASLTYECKDCGKTFTQYIGITLEHDYQDVVLTQAPTCNEDGFTKTVSACRMCSALNPVQPSTPVKVTPKLNHNEDMYAKFGWDKEPLTDNKGVEIFGEEGSKTSSKTTGEYKVDADTTVAYTITYTYTKPVCGEKDGSANYTCSLCGLNKTVVEKAADHDWDLKRVERPNGATYCTVAGLAYYECENCDATKQVEIAAEKEHKLNKTYYQELDTEILNRVWNESQDPDNYEDDWIEDTYTSSVIFFEHEFDQLIPCVDYKIVYHCENGGCSYEATERVPAKKADAHEFPPTADLTVDATCKDAGYYLYNCIYCSETKTVNIDKVAHTWGAAETTAATCDKPGAITKTCSKCGEVDTQEIPALGHEKKTETKAPNCTEKGYKKVTCAVCGEVLENTVLNYKHKAPAITEKVDEWGVYYGSVAPVGYTYYKAPTCTTPGARSYECELCNAKVVNETIEALNHTFGGVSQYVDTGVTQEATCTSVAQKAQKCNICGAFKAVDLKGSTKANHDYDENAEYIVLQKATCTEKGKYAYKCSNVKMKFDATTGEWKENGTCTEYVEKPIPALGHDFEYKYDDKTNSMVAKCTRCDLVNEVAKDKAEYEVTVSGKNGTIVLKNEDNAMGLDKVYVRYSVGYEKNGVSYAVVLTVKVEWDNGKWGEVGSFTVPTIQGSGTFTGASYIVTTDANADELGLAAAAANSYGSLIK